MASARLWAAVAPARHGQGPSLRPSTAGPTPMTPTGDTATIRIGAIATLVGVTKSCQLGDIATTPADCIAICPAKVIAIIPAKGTAITPARRPAATPARGIAITPQRRIATMQHGEGIATTPSISLANTATISVGGKARVWAGSPATASATIVGFRSSTKTWSTSLWTAPSGARATLALAQALAAASTRTEDSGEPRPSRLASPTPATRATWQPRCRCCCTLRPCSSLCWMRRTWSQASTHSSSLC
mmetsp:Transcript_32237/g.94246  ORF Transcript_32237/g.94246 Transcript_32237/m.94246 type:complete len:246 (+) Transcript_32237:174-911(+)